MLNDIAHPKEPPAWLDVWPKRTQLPDILANRAPGGKATVKLDACTREIDAVSDEPIPTGKTITIVQAIGNNTYLVKAV